MGECVPQPESDYPDLVQLNTKRTVLDAVGRELLEKTVGDQLAALGTAMTVFEANGDYATGGRPQGWCRVMDELSLPKEMSDPTDAIVSGKWSCRASCRRPALEAVQTGKEVDFHCPGGMLVHAAPVRVGDEIVGAISVGFGGAPTGEHQLEALAHRLHTTLEDLKAKAASVAPPPPPETEAVVKKTVEATARLFGEMIARRRADEEEKRARDIYTGMVAHDLRNPLSSIMLGLDYLLDAARLGTADARRMERMRRGTVRMRRMVEDLLDLTRARLLGGIPIRLQDHSLSALAAEMIDDVRLAHPEHPILLFTRGDTNLSCDADRIRGVIENLLVNAVRHGQGTPIEVQVSGEDPAKVVLSVHNGGDPIPSEMIPTIFEPFRQASKEGSRSTGLGLGLHIAREFVIAHGGTIEVRSDAEMGTLFTMTLPRGGGEAPPDSAV